MESMVFSSIILDDLLDYPKLTIGRCDLCLGFFIICWNKRCKDVQFYQC